MFYTIQQYVAQRVKNMHHKNALLKAIILIHSLSCLSSPT